MLKDERALGHIQSTRGLIESSAELAMPHISTYSSYGFAHLLLLIYSRV
jgi:hypothetical protein